MTRMDSRTPKKKGKCQTGSRPFWPGRFYVLLMLLIVDSSNEVSGRIFVGLQMDVASECIMVSSVLLVLHGKAL